MQERAVVTRAAVLDAALECLVEKGYTATTTLEIARRAGVSRGAQLHHFPTKAELLTAAVHRLFERRADEFRRAFAGVKMTAGDVDRVIDVLWSMFRGSTFVAWSELWLAARTDADLRVAVVEMDRRITEDSTAIIAELLHAEPGADPGFPEVALNFVFALMDGLAFRHMVPQTHLLPADQIIEILKDVARPAIDAARPAPASAPAPAPARRRAPRR